ncbi:MAG: flagellar biosynthesis protein FlhB [Phycisphaeraceae bacterium]|nr:flagellar biosynthesis protein FlhB [Phycisphaeraceae bacterium]
MAEELGERTEQPTGRRRADAREDGKVAKSTDLAAAVELGAALILIALYGPVLMAGFSRLLRDVLDSRGLDAVTTPDSIGELLSGVLTRSLWLAAPVAGVMFAVVMLAHVAQIGWFITTKPLQPKLSNLNPLSGLKKLVGRRNWIKTAVSSVKLVVAIGVAAAAVARDAPAIAAIPALDLGPAMQAGAAIVLHAAIWIIVLMLVIGIIDFLFQRWQLTQDLKMTRQEVKDERRSMEGDMETRARRLRMARSMIYQRIQQAVPTADVIVTNPTHFAVALKYDADSMDAPRVVAKGADLLAFRIREIASLHQIPIVEKPPLARALYANVEVGRSITPEFFEAVAEILAYVYRLEGRAA